MLECLAIKPDLIFLWDEAWFGFARFSPFLRRRTAMGAAAKLRAMFKDPEYKKRFQESKGALPDPDKVRLRVYETDSVHKSMSSLRQGSIIVVADQDFHTVEASFKEAFFTHTSTSPNLQIIASLDVARRQMELEGYELVQRAIQLAIEMRREVNQPSADLEVLQGRHAGRDDPGRVPQVRASPTTASSGWTLTKADGRARQRRVLPRSDAHHAAVRQRRLRRHAVQGAAVERIRHPDQQDLAQQRAGADQHQQHAQRPRAPDQGARRHVARDRQAPRRRRRAGAGRVQGARQVAGRGRARPAELQPLPRRVPRQPEEQDRRRPHARGVLPRLRRGVAAST